MGRDKALIELEGRAMAQRAADALAAGGASEVFAVGGDGPALASLGLDRRPDHHPGAGPLAATVTALEEASEEHVLVVGCDLLHPSPTAMAATVQALVDHPGAVAAVPVAGGHRQWVHAAWHRRALPALHEAVAAGERSIRRVAAGLLVFELEHLDPSALRDADTPGDLPGSPGNQEDGG